MTIGDFLNANSHGLAALFLIVVIVWWLKN